MPFQINVLAEEELGSVKATGDICITDSVEAVADLCRLPEFESHFGVIIDFSEVQSTPDLKELKQTAQAVKQYKDRFHGNIALVVEPKYVNMASIICMLVRVFGIRIEAYGNFESSKRFLQRGHAWIQG